MTMTANDALRNRRERRGCNPCVPCAGSLLGRWRTRTLEHQSKEKL
jgi:hypothetical protein